MFEYTVVHSLTLNGRTYGVGEKIVDPNLAALLDMPQYARNVSRHYVTTPPEELKAEVAEEPKTGDVAAEGRKPAPAVGAK